MVKLVSELVAAVLRIYDVWRNKYIFLMFFSTPKFPSIGRITPRRLRAAKMQKVTTLSVSRRLHLCRKE